MFHISQCNLGQPSKIKHTHTRAHAHTHTHTEKQNPLLGFIYFPKQPKMDFIFPFC